MEIASIFRHYIDVLAPWYDLCEEEQPFGRIVPAHALDNSVLFKAIIAFSAHHKHKVMGGINGLGCAFHSACVQDMLAVMENFPSNLRSEYLAATCLLRSYEILIGTSDEMIVPYIMLNAAQVIREKSNGIF